MFWNLLAQANSGTQNGSGTSTLIMLIALVGVVVVFAIFNRRAQTKRHQETLAMLNAIQPGNKVKTIGGICGVVVEVCPEENTFVLETGTEASGKSYIKFDKQAIYQTDAKVKKAEEVETPAPAGEIAEEFIQAPTEEAATEEAPIEEKGSEE